MCLLPTARNGAERCQRGIISRSLLYLNHVIASDGLTTKLYEVSYTIGPFLVAVQLSRSWMHESRLRFEHITQDQPNTA